MPFDKMLIPAVATFGALLALTTAGSSAETGDRETRPRVREIIVHAHALFDREENFFYRTANRLHTTTREHVVRREILYRQGDELDLALVEETERNLRALDFIVSARTEIIDVGDGLVDLHVHTRDRFSLRVEINYDLSSDESEYRFGLGDRNLFGYGKSVRGAIVSKEDGDRIRRVSYRDPRLFGSRHDFSFEVSHNSEVGNRATVALQRPFFSLRTNWAYGFRGRTEESEANYFEGGSETTVQQEIDDTQLFVSHGWGEPQFRKFATIHCDYITRDYGAASGPRSAEIFVPGDTESTSVTLGLSAERNLAFQERHFLDGLGATEDVRIGWSLTGRAGPVFRNEEGIGSRTNTLVGAGGAMVSDLSSRHLIACRLQGEGRFGAGEVRGWQAQAFYHHYWILAEATHTLAFSASFDAVHEKEGLTAELYLGEESGLRGYDSREFRGQKRLRFNLEHRWMLPGERWKFRAGVVPFLDAGYVWARGESPSFGDLKTSVGLGFRLGSVPLLGKRVARLDVAFPLARDRTGDRGGVTFLFTFNQAFSLLENRDGLSRDF